MTEFERTMTAFLDGEDSPDISNPIHSTQVAREYGFRAALVGGVTVYGWTVPPILAAFGTGWLENGWADVAFRRPVYPGDRLRITVSGEAADPCELLLVNQDGERCLVGTVGLGEAPFLAELALPARRQAEPRPPALPYLELGSAPIGRDLRPMRVPFSDDDARRYALEKQDDNSELWCGERPLIHPGWLAARMTPMLHHSYDYSPAIHTRSQVQHMGPAIAGQAVTVAGRFIDAFERKGNHYAVADGVIMSEGGAEIARIRHTTIFHVAPKVAGSVPG